MTDIERIKLLIDMMKDNYSFYISNMWSTLGLIVLAIGWLLTSGKAKNYMSTSLHARSIATLTVIVTGFIQALVSLRFYTVSSEITQLILAFQKEIYYETYLISRSRYLFNLGMVVTLLLSIIFLIWSKSSINNKQGS